MPVAQSPSEPMIDISGFGKKYGDFVAVEDLNLKIARGELFGFIGPNGAGKSTTIRFLATLLQPTTGDAIIAGHSVRKEPLAVRHVIGYMPDHFGVYDGMKVWEFLDFFAAAYQLKQQRRREVIGEVLELLDLTHKRDDFVNGLSRGMKQRLCVAKTLLHDPPVLILDEPTSGLDPRARIEMKALLSELRRMGKTILISSHILSELADCCTSIGIIERGRLLMHGPIHEIYRHLQRNRIIEIRTLGDVETAAQVARSEPQVINVEVEPARLRVELEGDDAAVAGLLKRFQLAGVQVVSFADKEPTLEDVFMSVTRGLVN
jgi:ABC-2 type transport system ATP-binding protein